MQNFYNTTTFKRIAYEDNIDVNKYIPLGYMAYTLGNEPQELLDFLNHRTTEEIISHFKGLYLGVVDVKLKELDYDSLATVKLWEGDATFGTEATKILTWYKAIIAYNYALVTSGVVPTDEEYLAGIPVYV